jgi:hypothetical protein
MRSKAPLTTLVTVLLFAAMSGVASAKPVTVTFHEKNETDSFHDVIPCLGDGGVLGTITTTENGVLHVTAAAIDDQGTPDPEDDAFIPPYHVTGTFTGTFVAVPDDPSFPTFRGHFTQWFGENSNRSNFVTTFTFTVIGWGSDGSRLRFHETAHFSVTPNGVTFEFDKGRCF